MSHSTILQAPATVNPQSDFMPYDRIRVTAADTFHGMTGTVLSVHYHPIRPFVFVQLDDPRYEADVLFFSFSELEGTAERKAVSRC